MTLKFETLGLEEYKHTIAWNVFALHTPSVRNKYQPYNNVSALYTPPVVVMSRIYEYYK